jgi:hypothetical protein
MLDLLFLCSLQTLLFLALKAWADWQFFGQRRVQAFFCCLTLSYGSLVLAAWLENREGPRIYHVSAESPADSLHIQPGMSLTEIQGRKVTSRRELLAFALDQQQRPAHLRVSAAADSFLIFDKRLDLNLGTKSTAIRQNETDFAKRNRRIDLTLGAISRAARQSETDFAVLLQGVELFSQRALMKRKPHPLLQSQLAEARRGVPIVGLAGQAVGSKAELRRLVERQGKGALFTIQLLHHGRQLELIGNFAHESFPRHLPITFSKLQYLGAADWGLEVHRFPLELLPERLRGADQVVLSAVNSLAVFPGMTLDPKPGDEITFKVAFGGGYQTIKLDEQMVSLLRQEGLLLNPELAFPLSYGGSANPFLSAARELALRLKRAINPWDYQFSAIARTWGEIPQRWYEIPELRWQTADYWLAQWGILCLLGSFFCLFSLPARPHAQAAFACVSLLYFFHELFVVKVLL